MTLLNQAERPCVTAAALQSKSSVGPISYEYWAVVFLLADF